jgi:bile acid-coenzyme A ligase
MGWMDEDGFVYLADRRKDLILSGGANIYPAEVEGALLEHPAVESCAVIGLPDDDLGQVVHAVVHLVGEATVDDLQAHMAERLVRYKQPRSWELTAEPVRDDAGKVRRSALAAAASNPADATGTGDATEAAEAVQATGTVTPSGEG